MNQRYRLTGMPRRVLILLLLLIVAPLGLGAYLSRRISQLETAVWERSEFGELAGSESVLQDVVTSQIIPGFLRNRASGLLGDLSYHRKDFKTALDYYGLSMGRLKDGGFAKLLHSIPAAWQGPGDFHRGYRDYNTSPPPAPSLNDADLELPPSTKSLNTEAWRDLTGIPPVDAAEAREIWAWIGSSKEAFPDYDRAEDLLEKYHGQIVALRRFHEPMPPPDPDDFSDLVTLRGFAGLMMLDALQCAESGSLDQAGSSFDTAYTLMECPEQHPRMVTLFSSVNMRSKFADLLESETGGSLRSFFRQKHCLEEKIWKQLPLVEYQATKRLTAETMPASDPTAVRLRGRVLAKQAAFWRGVREHGTGNSVADFSEAMAGYVFKNRRFFQRADTASYADGRRAAEECEDCMAEIVHRLGVPSMGSMDQDFAALHAREAALAQPQAK
ncbi:hypothetical protein [Prosthecobacter sp.]|uniref:hypothetical protein n=1 Tax=Prosthecobacter sp. TaxID=1965333 RepID=UPI003784EB3A